MKNLTVARRYARALFDIAQDMGTLDDVLQGMSNLNHAFLESRELQVAFVNPLISPDDKKKLATVATSNKLVLRFVELLARRKRLNLLSAIYELLGDMQDAKKNIRRALVKSAAPLTDQQKREVEAGLARSLGGTVIGRFDIDAALLGGVRVQVGDKVLDATVRGRLDSMRHALVHSAN